MYHNIWMRDIKVAQPKLLSLKGGGGGTVLKLKLFWQFDSVSTPGFLLKSSQILSKVQNTLQKTGFGNFEDYLEK